MRNVFWSGEIGLAQNEADDGHGDGIADERGDAPDHDFEAEVACQSEGWKIGREGTCPMARSE